MLHTKFRENRPAGSGEEDSCRRNLVLTDLLAFAIDFCMLPRYIPEHFGIFPKFNDGRR